MRLYKILDSIVKEGEENYWEKYNEDPADNMKPFEGSDNREEIESMFLSKDGKGFGTEGSELVKSLVDEDGLEPRQANAAVRNIVPLFIEKLDFMDGKLSLPVNASEEIMKEKNMQPSRTINAVMDAVDNAIRFVL